MTPKMSHFFHSNCCCICKFQSIKDAVRHYHFTDPAYADDTTILVSAAPSRQVFSNQCLCYPMGLNKKLSWRKTKLQNIGAGDPPSTILIDCVPIEGVAEFIYLGSKQMVILLTRCSTQDWICLFSDEFSRVYGIAVLSVSAPKYTCTRH